MRYKQHFWTETLRQYVDNNWSWTSLFYSVDEVQHESFSVNTFSSKHDHAQLDLTNDVERPPLQDFTMRNCLARKLKPKQDESVGHTWLELRLLVNEASEHHWSHRIIVKRDTSLNITYRKPDRKFTNFRLIALHVLDRSLLIKLHQSHWKMKYDYTCCVTTLPCHVSEWVVLPAIKWARLSPTCMIENMQTAKGAVDL